MSEDKPEVSARVTWTGTGIYLPTDTPRPEQVRDAVDQILTKPEYRARAMEMAREFAAYDSAKKLPELLEALVTERQVRAHGVPDGFPADCRSSRMRQVEVDVRGRVATVAGGALAGEVALPQVHVRLLQSK
jgi:hypothetical protein